MNLQTRPMLTALLFTTTLLQGQPQQPTTTTLTAVPRLVRVSSAFHPANGSAPAAMENVTLAIYVEETGGTPLWQETQNVSIDSDARYSVLLGSTRNEGLPLELFASGEPRWLGVQFQRPGEAEQPRVRLASVPYALKAADADTLGGRPLSDFMLADPATASTGSSDSGAPKAGVTAKKAAAPKVDIGTLNSIAKFVDMTSDVGNSALFENSGMVGLGTTSPFDVLHVRYTSTNGALAGYAVQNLGATATSYSGMLFYDQNGALGQFQGFNNSTHEYRINNIAKTSGSFDGSINFMLGSNSKFLVRSDGDIDIAGNVLKDGTLFLHTLGNNSTAVGFSALAVNTGFGNTASGVEALQFNTGNFNTASGAGALLNNTTGTSNTASGYEALFNNTNGSGNIALGNMAGNGLTTGNNNIMIGNHGNAGEGSTIRMGDTQTKTFIAGIRGTTTGNPDAVPVGIDSNGQLGTASSSRRFKEDIQDMAQASANLQRLRPVTYRYKQPYADGSKPLDYGLIAEEVAEVYPDLVVKSKDGQMETVQYQKLTPMLLNELQKEHQHAQQQDETIRQLQARLAALEALLSSKVAATTTGGR